MVEDEFYFRYFLHLSLWSNRTGMDESYRHVVILKASLKGLAFLFPGNIIPRPFAYAKLVLLVLL